MKFLLSHVYIAFILFLSTELVGSIQQLGVLPYFFNIFTYSKKEVKENYIILNRDLINYIRNNITASNTTEFNKVIIEADKCEIALNEKEENTELFYFMFVASGIIKSDVGNFNLCNSLNTITDKLTNTTQFLNQTRFTLIQEFEKKDIDYDFPLLKLGLCVLYECNSIFEQLHNYNKNIEKLGNFTAIQYNNLDTNAPYQLYSGLMLILVIVILFGIIITWNIIFHCIYRHFNPYEQQDIEEIKDIEEIHFEANKKIT